MANKTTLINDLPIWQEVDSALGQVLSLQIALELAAHEMDKGDVVAAMCGIRHLVYHVAGELENVGKMEVRHA
ncbi:hypothetical protein IDB44_002757 [Salmonella enterica subsp. enterica serovar Worthington]|nr:hypothetical protein [Salmonella enterica subsp. enterica serovar Worthington]